MILTGYALIDGKGAVLQIFGDLPNLLKLPNGDVVQPATLGAYGKFLMVERWVTGERPTEWHVSVGETTAFDGRRIVVTQQFELVSIEDRKAVLSQRTMEKREESFNEDITFDGVRFQCRPDDRENVEGAALLALIAISAGAKPGGLRWHGGDSDFVWIAEDNSLVPMDAFTVIEFAKTVAAAKSAAIFRARERKNAIVEAQDHDALDKVR